MNKEELTRTLEYTEKKHRHDTVNTFDTDISMMCADVLRVLKNCIEIPNNATNGDMIRAMFPQFEVFVMGDNQQVTVLCGEVRMDIGKDWWNSPYRKEQE